MSVMLWFTLITTPAIITFPDLRTTLRIYLNFNEFFWALDIVRKLFLYRKPGQDVYTSAVKYIKSTLILDLIALMPQLVR